MIYVSNDSLSSILVERVPRPCSDLSNVRLALSLSNMQRADKRLRKAKENTPSYTGQYSDADYIAQEQEDWNRAADDLADAVRALMGIELIPTPTESPFQEAMSKPWTEVPGISDAMRKRVDALSQIEYVGDLVRLIDEEKVFRGLSIPHPFYTYLRSIPARQGREVWARP